jgi:TPR repeat protein
MQSQFDGCALAPIGVSRDSVEAVKWYRKAAAQGLAQAQNNLGTMYDGGQGVPQDYGEAMTWFRKAAEQGYAGAQDNIGVMYEKGHGVPQDCEIAPNHDPTIRWR